MSSRLLSKNLKIKIYKIIILPVGHNEEVHSLYRSANMVRVIKSRRLRWAGHVARKVKGRIVFKILTGRFTTGNIIVLYILIFKLLERSREDKSV